MWLALRSFAVYDNERIAAAVSLLIIHSEKMRALQGRDAAFHAV
jgi:hypothetical protein